MKKQVTVHTAGWIYAFIHFSVDAACFYFLFSRLNASPAWWALAVLYDAVAFVPQSFFGLLSDRFPKINFGFTGCVLVLAALVLPFDIPALLIISLGNALAHIGGAQHTLCGAEGKIAPCGIYVSGGSFGVIAGQLLAVSGFGSVLVPLAFMAISAGLTVAVAKIHLIEDYSSEGFDITSRLPLAVILLLTFAAVAVRSYVGYAVPSEWNSGTAQKVLLYCAMGAGKLLGGILCDKIGYRKTTFISLVVALPFLLFGNTFMVLSLIGIGLFSMTMPVTVGILVSKFPFNPCFAFGITTVALFVGTFPAFFVRPEGLLAHQITVFVLSVVAAVCINMSLKKGK
ncbi:MAG: hypothetical protein IKM27_05030 [Clostridia bacterium]|nr:hypothetical protein [Clostridia bacterium]